MTDLEIMQRGLDEKKLNHLCIQQGLQYYVRSSISDDSFDQYAKDLVKACSLLNQLIQSDRKVYVFCMSGWSRAPTLAVLYLCLHKNHQPD